MNNKLKIIALLLVALIAVTSVSVMSTLSSKRIETISKNQAKISEDKAKSLADFEVSKAELKNNKQIGKNVWVLKSNDKKLKKMSIDAETGEIISYIDMSKQEKSSESIVSLDDVKKNLKQEDGYKLSRAKDVGQYYLLTWTENKNDVEFRCNHIIAMVNKNTGETFGYSKVTHEVSDLNAKVTSKEATKTATVYFYKNVGDNIEKTESELVVDLDNSGEAKLMWAIKLYSDKPYSGYWHEVFVDAKTGDFLKYDALK